MAERVFDHGDEPPGVFDVQPDVAGPEEAGLPSLVEDRGQLHVGLVHAGLITTRRRGSSPSDPVATPS
ncbi:MAG TPA: hypothetical protein VN636_06900, partial [Acidimicrobiia bacterium]|nr:hypothetical protein [Acidimicrobiia bacterium]